MSKIDDSATFENAEYVGADMPDMNYDEVYDATTETAHLADEQMTLAPVSKDPIDIFGDLALTGQGELERGMVPDVIYDFAKDAGDRIGLNAGSIAIPMLSTAAVAIRHGWRVQPKLDDYTWKEAPVIWTGITGPSGANKSAALDVGLVPLRTAEDQWARESADMMENYILDMEEHKALLSIWRKTLKEDGREAAGDMPRKPRMPKRRRSIVENATMEQILQIASENPDGILQYKDELVGWIASFDAYSGGGKGGASQDRAAALSGYNSSSASKDRVGAQGSGGTHIHAECVSLNVVGGIQDMKVKEVLSKGGSDGLMARFLFVEARPKDGRDNAPNKEAQRAWKHTVNALLRMETDLLNGNPTVFKMTPEAAKIGADLRLLRRQMQLLPIPAGLREHLAKWDGMWARICLIFHMVEIASKPYRPGFTFDALTQEDHDIMANPAGLTEISAATATQAYNLLTKFLLPEAVRIYTQVITAEDGIEHARWIADHILAHKANDISVYQIGRAYTGLKGDQIAIRNAMNSLELLGWVYPAGARASIGDFGKMKWKVNPRCHELFSERAESERKRRADALEQIRTATEKAKSLRA